MKEINPLKIGDIVEDLICEGKVKRKNNTYKYIMRCKKCGRVKEMLSSTIRKHRGTTHKACGKGIKTKDPIFYLRWQAMRTRTTNKNYWGAKYYSQNEICKNVREFARVHNLDNSTIFDCLSKNRSTTNHKGYKFVCL